MTIVSSCLYEYKHITMTKYQNQSITHSILRITTKTCLCNCDKVIHRLIEKWWIIELKWAKHFLDILKMLINLHSNCLARKNTEKIAYNF